MRFFALHCPDSQFGQQPADQMPWFHIVTLQPAGRAADLRQTESSRLTRTTICMKNPFFYTRRAYHV